MRMHPNNQTRAFNSAQRWIEDGRRKLDGTPAFMVALRRPDCTDAMKSDIYRESALIALRLCRFEAAEGYLNRAATYAHLIGDRSLMASNLMVAGQLCLIKGDVEAAEDCHSLANTLWKSVPDANPQMVADNRFYWLRTLAFLGRPRRQVYREFIATIPPSQARRRDAVLFVRLGLAGALQSLAREAAANLSFRAKARIERERDTFDRCYFD